MVCLCTFFISIRMKSFLRTFLASAVLALGACVSFSSCSNESEELFQEESPVVQKVWKSVPYSITINKSTRAALSEDGHTLVFQQGDKLLVAHAIEDDDDIDIDYMGCLTLKSGAGTTSATFEGKIYFTEDEPKAGDELEVQLFGENGKMGKIIPMSELDPSMPDDVLIPDLNDVEDHDAHAISKDLKTCIEEYSVLRGGLTYGNTSMDLAQTMAFLDFDVALPGVAEGTDVKVKIEYDGGEDVENTKCPLTVSKDGSGNTHVTFTAALDAEEGLDLSTAVLTLTPAGKSPKVLPFPSELAELDPNKVYKIVQH